MIFLNLGLILIAIGLLGIFFGLRHDNDMFGVSLLSGCILFVLGVVIVLCWRFDRDINPTAIDVYRGKTTLEITYKDGVAIDSIVVFKERK